uniref:Uncharacterized protein n=1 Tax=Plectus sambesii TaxID=2011161 RepID=A0A914VNH3_9BILA
MCGREWRAAICHRRFQTTLPAMNVAQVADLALTARSTGYVFPSAKTIVPIGRFVLPIVFLSDPPEGKEARILLCLPATEAPSPTPRRLRPNENSKSKALYFARPLCRLGPFGGLIGRGD